MSTQIRACFNGCSYTTGEGFPLDKRQNYIYDRLVCSRLNFLRENIAVAGSCNYNIFMRSAKAIVSQQFDIVFTQWTALNRLWLYPGPDVYFTLNDEKPDFRYRDVYISKKDKQKFNNIARILNHDYHNILELVDYCCLLDNLGEKNKTKIVYINGLVPWTKEITNSEFKNFENELSTYTKNILDFENRGDEEIFLLLQKLQQKILTLNMSHWVNIFDSFGKNSTDIGPEGHHPGINSHKWMADQIQTHLNLHQLI
jgi:hypothetical protein